MSSSIQTQATSPPFLRLPLELRELIYQNIFSHQTIHIYRQGCSSRHGDLGAKICCLQAEDFEETYKLSCEKSTDPLRRRTGKYTQDGYVPDSVKRHFTCLASGGQGLRRESGMALLRVCRQIHFEAAALPYRYGTFYFNDEFALETFVTEALMPRQRSAITSIQLGLSVRAGMNFARCLTLLPNLNFIGLFVTFLNGDWSTPWLLATGGYLGCDDDKVQWPAKLGKARVCVVAGYDKGIELEDATREERRKVAEKLERFLKGERVDDGADVMKGAKNRSMETWRFLLRNGRSI